MEEEKENTTLNIEGLSITNKKLITIVLYTMFDEDPEKYDKLSQIFFKRAEMGRITKDLLK